MKVILLSILFASILFVANAKEPQNKQILGMWQLVSASTNGKPNPESAMDRTFEYTKDGYFEGKIIIGGVEQPFNQGKYFLPNDSTMICIHSNKDGRLSPLSYTYNFTVVADTFHLYGIYFSNVVSEPQYLQMNYIDERWVKIK